MELLRLAELEDGSKVRQLQSDGEEVRATPLPGVSMTLHKNGVITQNNGVIDAFLKGHGDSR